MRASNIEFRLRMLIQIVIVFIGFWAPWIDFWDWGKRVSLLEWLALEISRMGLARFTVAAPAVIACGALVAAVGAWLRVWGAAYLGYGTVHNANMQGGALMADGPYRCLRNPLYLGGWCIMIAISLAMPPSGALFTIVLTGIFYLRLILGEEAFLTGRLGEPYRQYLRSVPRLAPRLRTNIPPAGGKPRWLVALATEIFGIGAFVSIAVLSWRYDNQLVMEGILVSFAVSLVVRGLMLARVATVAFLACAAIGWGLLHLRPLKAGIISLGIALIVHALLPKPTGNSPRSGVSHPKPDT